MKDNLQSIIDGIKDAEFIFIKIDIDRYKTMEVLTVNESKALLALQRGLHRLRVRLIARLERESNEL